MEFFVAQLVNGILVGSFVALVALGYTIVYGVLRLINFANGSTYMLGAFIGLSLLNLLGDLPTWLAIVVTLLITGCATGLVGVATERFAYRPLRSQPVLVMLVSALAMAFVIENLVLAIPAWGSSNHPYPVSLPGGSIKLGSVTILASQMVILGAAVLLLVAMYLFVTRTIHGKAMRAVAVDRDAAQLVGVNINRVLSTVFFASAFVAGVTGVLAGLYFGTVQYKMGFNVGAVAFTAAVLGGIGNIPGAVLGGLLIGVLQSLGTGYLGSEWQDVFAFVILIAVLIVRPHGILGEKVGSRA
ncbi:branched-chain amino acid ABC transporter permease [Pimelobacter simplex]|uniref:branched-chain amino acid ABC transporter permease n=1 Tax=Nocardioides simplex TaxID=2045 RepID=UPI003AAB2F40